MTPLQIGQIVSRLRAKNGQTQKQCAEISGLTQSQWADLERGRFMPSIRTLECAAKAVGCELVIRFKQSR